MQLASTLRYKMSLRSSHRSSRWRSFRTRSVLLFLSSTHTNEDIEQILEASLLLNEYNNKGAEELTDAKGVRCIVLYYIVISITCAVFMIG
jgi:hypothetical protein